MDETVQTSTTKLTKLRIIKNLILISLAFFLLFTAYDGLSMLQSTMNKKGGVGVVSQAVGYISFCISALLLPKYVIKKLGCKSSLIMSISFYLPCIAANFYPKWYIMIPGGVFTGIGASILWGSQCTYFNESAVRYSRLITTSSPTIRNQSSVVSSNHTSVEILSGRNSEGDITKESSSKAGAFADGKLELTTSENSVVRFKCRNSGCGNEDKFIVSEIQKSCVQFSNKSVENSNALSSIEKKTVYGTMECISPGEISHPPSQTETRHEQNETDLQELYLSKVNEAVENKIADSAKLRPSKRNSHCQLVFQRANTLESVTALFFGCHGIAFYSAQICSNGISYYVLNGDENKEVTHFNGCSCGAQFCHGNPWCINDDVESVSRRIRYLLTGISVASAVVAALLVFLFVDPLKKVNSNEESEKISLRLISATVNHNKKKEQLFLIPISFFEGMQQGFYTADFTKSYVGCAWGASNVGLVSVFYGSACVVSSLATGFLVKYIGRRPLFLLCQIISLSMMIFLMLWKPNSDSTYNFFIAATFFGTVTGIYWSQLLSFYGLLFKKDEEAAFASYYLWSSLGWTTSFLYSNHLCTYVKIYLLFAVSIIGTTGYLFTERSYQLKKDEGTVAST